MISEANRIIEQIGKESLIKLPTRRNRAVFRITAITLICSLTVVCAVLLAAFLTK